ncbi:dTDP-4-dehydrorhamnose reductase [Xylanimonas oleitrophica]|uniref:dTDP-4-dehydrorhamnose reductase n=1 Tax=Xylanimonas oleitrophica TaxID=2607479 RepID=A0A2W5X206_9MICO|nr:dTDP-4-dehydrorhamnose reductase [Xylanimonas oleitrophica]PZR54355.1 dTDP-4-dehydrorhamnose reductase [Xylanimonas oleitrophica]
MRWFVTGGGGMLATDLQATLAERGHEVVTATRQDLDITDADACAAAVAGFDVVANAAAWTDVDGAEDQEPQAFAVNAVGAANLARAASATGARLVHVSTDYVFAGDATEPYRHDAPVAPRSAYGRTKAAGEWAVLAAGPEHLVVRTAWLYGATTGKFPRTIARVLRERGAATVVDDQVGQPTWTADLADLMVRLVDAGAPGGIYHGTSGGQCSWFELAQEVAVTIGLDASAVSPTSSAAFASKAPRPAYSVLSHDSLEAAGVAPIGDWRERFRAAAPVIVG